MARKKRTGPRFTGALAKPIIRADVLVNLVKAVGFRGLGFPDSDAIAAALDREVERLQDANFVSLWLHFRPKDKPDAIESLARDEPVAFYRNLCSILAAEVGARGCEVHIDKFAVEVRDFEVLDTREFKTLWDQTRHIPFLSQLLLLRIDGMKKNGEARSDREAINLMILAEQKAPKKGQRGKARALTQKELNAELHKRANHVSKLRKAAERDATRAAIKSRIIALRPDLADKPDELSKEIDALASPGRANHEDH